MVEITDKEYQQYRILRKIYLHSKLAEEFPDLYFICGEAGEKDSMGLPDHIMVCPSCGLDGMAMYTKTTEYSAPGY